MNYPIWELPAPGLLIAAVAIVHVFISHFAVGGGLFLVLAERKARAEGDAPLLAFVRSLSGFFVLLTLVLGALTGVGIWFTIALVQPQAGLLFFRTMTFEAVRPQDRIDVTVEVDIRCRGFQRIQQRHGNNAGRFHHRAGPRVLRRGVMGDLFNARPKAPACSTDVSTRLRRSVKGH